VLTLLFPNPSIAPTTWVFMCRPTSVDRFSCLDASVIELRGLSVDDAQNYLLERATSIGRPNLFAPDALDLIVHQTRGSPRLLLSVASLAFFTAGWGRATQIGVRHVAYWLKSETSSDFVEDSGAPRGGVFRSESANHTKAKHRSGYELDVYRPIPGPKGDGSKVKALVLKRFPLGRARRWTGATPAIAASIGLAGVLAAFLLGGNDASVGARVTAPSVPNLVAAEANRGQTPTAMTVSPDIRTSAAEDAVEPAPVKEPAGKATAALGNGGPDQVEQPRVAAKRTRPSSPMKTARAARAPKSAGSPAATKTAVQRARDAMHAARQAEDVARRTAETALQAQQAARQANEAAHRADQAARRADQAASQAERAARQAHWRIRIQFPQKAITEPRRAS